MPAERLASEIIPLAKLADSSKKSRSPSSLRCGSLVSVRPFGFVELKSRSTEIRWSDFHYWSGQLPAVPARRASPTGTGGGYAVLLKPGAGAASVMIAFRELLQHAGLPQDLLCVLEEDAEVVRAVIETGVDKVFFTGSGKAGRAVYRLAADELTPVTLELSGSDRVRVDRRGILIVQPTQLPLACVGMAATPVSRRGAFSWLSPKQRRFPCYCR